MSGASISINAYASNGNYVALAVHNDMCGKL